MRSLFFKNFSLIALLVVFSFTILGASFVILGRSFAVSEKKKNISQIADAVADTASVFSESGMIRDWNFRLILRTVAQSSDTEIFLTDINGLIFSSSEFDADSTKVGKQVSAEVMEKLYQSASTGEVFFVNSFRSENAYYLVGVPVFENGSNSVSAFVFVGSDFTAITDAWTVTSKLFFTLAVTVMLLALFMSYVASKRQAEPINEMAAAARRFARGDFSVRVTNYGNQDEVGALTESFNSMAESLERSEQLRSEFIANVSHELKTPMTTISGFADGILDGTIPPEDHKKYLAIISSETKRLSRMVRQMLQMSRIQNVDNAALLSRSFDLSEVIMRTIVSFEPKITEHGLDMDAQIPEESIIVRGDEDSITQVFYNLMDNAIKFSEKGSTIGVSLWKQDGKAVVTIKNHGECICPEELPFVFDRFHKTDKSRSRDRDGVGLGLSIVKTILNNHNEDISATSRDGVTKFVFTVRLK